MLSNVDELYSSTVGPFANAFPANDKATSAVIAVTVTAIDELGNESARSGVGHLAPLHRTGDHDDPSVHDQHDVIF